MATSSKPRGGTKKPRPPRCHTCGAAIRVPEGWSAGPAVRRHYWRKHPEVMQPKGSKR
ncbi:MAG TPA: hypothetical protein VG929_09285 [Actinomycetota bacterium]|nr:hypothetical protein [Actinomycetota bacterium]